MELLVTLPLLQSLAFLVTGAVAHTPSMAACHALSQKYSSDVFFPNSTGYASLNSYFAANIAQHPVCIFAPTTHTSAASSLPIASRHRAQLAIRSGGHSFNANFSSSSSIILSLRHLKTIFLSDDKKTVTLSPGLTWEEVYGFLQPHGLAVAGGRLGDVGAGGFLLGGGISFNIYSRGLGCDNVVSFTVATVEGKITTASANENADLFRSLKGVGSPSVLVLSITMQTFSLGQMWSAVTNQPVTTPMLEALADFRATDDEKAHLISTLQLSRRPGGNGTDFTAFNTMVYAESSASAPETFKGLYGTAKQNEVLRQSNTTLLRLVTGAPQSGFPRSRSEVWTWTLLSPDVALLAHASSVFSSTWQTTVNEGMATAGLILIPLGPRVGDGTNVLGLEKGKNYVVSLLAINYDDPALDGEVITKMEAVEKEIEKAARKKRMWSEWKYANYALKNQEAALWRGYGRGNVEFLERVRRRYDPDGKWEKIVPGGWKLPGV